MEFNKSFTIVVSIGLIMFFGMFWVLSISNAYINSPNQFTIKFEIENNTREVIKDLNGSIIINNYYGNFTKEITLCKDKTEYLTLDNGVISKREIFENVYNCTLEKKYE